ncbi:N-acetylglucosamine-6-phosphate deacetylase [Rhodobacter veldkampii DSM 11550]|uniref:N-acetylglucosamine-6-phosphate deacetylase n=1 Tax=Phaeovulum veldkampii DSM 11550 TaxID=1185920 RepID=A0A2T4JFY7_9RHOB|nr:N-acetylglucosamine-6-phosphate deacetylase [Phaeovulum veldkampii]MBK5945167.1 N-acetylglucosamine-6-phosphate deacetylase [Phaeovulum veldkampii DSM 11550]PTE16806.1 N-acetylglucosamine-6-phosphate deacetylase [Phaeovulum veldkampii DSM 11550]TDQ54661.1 N-acetylglucosamine 6-phosphate deacetylase [Phaeovulum veldkampii DSM 11550]
MALQALTGARIFDGTAFHDNAGLLVEDGEIVGIVAQADVPRGAVLTALPGGALCPGFIDAQVNGGAGRLLNDAPDAPTMQMIAGGHRPFGTTGLLPTLITDHPFAVTAAIAAAREAVRADGAVLGLHLEGPHLAPARKGTHLAELMHPLGDAAMAELLAAARHLPVLLLTLAAEQVTPAQVRALTAAGAVVSIGHSDCDHRAAAALFAAGARGVTHLFNAMSGLGHRAPGLVGAALEAPDVWAGIIADGHHVDPLALRIALRAKRGPGRLFLVTDAMSLVGQPGDRLTLNGREIRRLRDGQGCSRLTLADGTLAGSDLDMASALRFAVAHLEVPLAEALRMAATYPADFLGLGSRGRLRPGARADLVHLDAGLQVCRVWIRGRVA